MNKTSQQGVVAVYIALLMLMILVSSALVFSVILSRQLVTAQEVISAERAFTSANSGLEKALYGLTKLGQTDAKGEGEISYDGEVAHYTIETASVTNQVPCVISLGTFRAEQRRVSIGVCPPSNP